jgi:hypothetical protein
LRESLLRGEITAVPPRAKFCWRLRRPAKENKIMIKKLTISESPSNPGQAVPYYEKALGLKCEHREEVPSQKVRTAFFTVGEVHLELLEPTSPESPIAKFLEKNPGGRHPSHRLWHGRCGGPAQAGRRRGREVD